MLVRCRPRLQVESEIKEVSFTVDARTGEGWGSPRVDVVVQSLICTVFRESSAKQHCFGK